MKIRPVGAESFHVDRWTDRRIDEETGITKITVTFRDSSEAPSKLQRRNQTFLHVEE